MSEQTPRNPEQEPKPERIWRRLGEYAVFSSQLNERIPHRGNLTWGQVLSEDFGPDNWRFVPEESDDSTEVAGIENATRAHEETGEFMNRKQGAFDVNALDWDKANPGYSMYRKGHIEVSDPVHDTDNQPEEE